MMRASFFAAIAVAVGLAGALLHFVRNIDPDVEPVEHSLETIKGVGTITNVDRVGRDLLITTNTWLYCYPPTGEVILIEKAYLSDYASIPGFARWLFSEHSSKTEPAVVHDWLYAVGESGRRKDADDIFLYAMKQRKVGLLQRAIMYGAVRVGGAAAYGNEAEWNFGPPNAPLAEHEKPKRRDTAAIATIDCADFESEARRIRRDFMMPEATGAG